MVRNRGRIVYSAAAIPISKRALDSERLGRDNVSVPLDPAPRGDPMVRFVLACALPLAVICTATSAPRARAAGPYDDLLRHAPPASNVLALIDAKAAYASELAKQEQWKEKGQPGHRGLGFVPSDAERVVIAADVNLNSMSRYFQVGLVRVDRVPQMKALAAAEGGSVDKVADEFVVWSPRDVYFTTLSGTELAAIHPADRQGLARWLHAAKAKRTGELSPYLRKAADGAGANTVTIAVDLEDSLDRNVLKLTLPSSPTVAKNKKVDVGTLATVLSSAKGLTFSAKIDASITAAITIEFGFEPTRYRPILPELFRELLEGQGVAIAGIEAWKPEFTPTSMTLSGSLATADLKRIVSLFSFPSPEGEIDPATKAAEPTAAATRRYLAAVETILADLRKTKDSPDYEKTATWHDKAAAQLDQLSKQGVDPVAAGAASQSAKRLRAIAQSLRGVPIDVGALEKGAYYSSRPSVGMAGGPWGWRPFVTGPSQVDTNIPQVREQMLKVIADDQKRRQEAWSQTDRIMADARLKMAEKYKIKF
jgi:hypothetical protein